MEETPQCFHNYPYVDEDPKYFKKSNDERQFFSDPYKYECRSCGKILLIDLMDDPSNFMDRFDKLHQNPQ